MAALLNFRASSVHHSTGRYSLFPPEARSSIAPQLFEQEYYRAELDGKRLNSVSELPKADILRAESFKAIIAGDPITGRVIRNQPRTITPIAGHIFAANALPSTDDLSRAFWSRFLLIIFNRVFAEQEQQKDLADLIISQEMPGVAAWALEGARRLLQRHPLRYTEPPSHAQVLAEWRIGADQVALFVEDACDPTDVLAERTGGQELYDAYREWAARNGHKCVNNGNFAVRLRNLGFKRVKPDSKALYRLKLKGASPAFTPTFYGPPKAPQPPNVPSPTGQTTGYPPANPPDGSFPNSFN